jgi:hypothetical protein
MNYHFEIELADSTLEGWAAVSLEMDGDGDFKSMDIEAIEVEPSRERHMKIQRGYVPIEDRSVAPEETLVVAHLMGPALGEIIDLWQETEDFRSQCHQWSGMC